MVKRSRMRVTGSSDDEENAATQNYANLKHSIMPTKSDVISDNYSKGKPCEEDLGQSFMQMTAADKRSVLLLLLLYLLQGIPLGLAGSVPYILVSKNVPYSVQATFSFVTWPFSIKLLWAPLVDSIYSSRFGRRKSWLIPVQYLLAFCMLFLSNHIEGYLGNGDSVNVAVVPLTAAFFGLNFLAATQDIAVDGWALNMLSRNNVGWAGTCNSVGQTAGYFLSYVVFLALESADFCNNYLRPVGQSLPHGIITFSDFLRFFGLVFIIVTTLVMLFKREHIEPDVKAEKPELLKTYKMLWKIICNPGVQTYLLTLFSIKFAFGTADGITALKLIERGVPKEKLAFFSLIFLPLELSLPVILARYTAGPRPLSFYMRAAFPRLLIGLACVPIIYWTPYFQNSNGTFPVYYYISLCFFFGLHQIFIYTMFVSQMAYHNKISDSRIGGSCMTLYNTASNLAGNWPVTFLLYTLSFVTKQECSVQTAGSCSTPSLVQACISANGTCVTSVEGYYVLSVFCFMWGLVALRWRWRPMEKLEDLSS